MTVLYHVQTNNAGWVEVSLKSYLYVILHPFDVDYISLLKKWFENQKLFCAMYCLGIHLYLIRANFEILKGKEKDKWRVKTDRKKTQLHLAYPGNET